MAFQTTLDWRPVDEPPTAAEQDELMLCYADADGAMVCRGIYRDPGRWAAWIGHGAFHSAPPPSFWAYIALPALIMTVGQA